MKFLFQIIGVITIYPFLSEKIIVAKEKNIVAKETMWICPYYRYIWQNVTHFFQIFIIFLD